MAVYGFDVVNVLVPTDKKDPVKWDVNETNGFQKIRANDNRFYKVWVGDKSQPFQKKWWYTVTNQQETANVLGTVRKDIDKILIYLTKNEELWNDLPIAFGIYHTIQLHNDNFEYLEMRPNQDGILGLNKPKEITVIKAEVNGKVVNYELGTKRNILLTVRNQNTGAIKNYKDILDLAIHELTHTTCNDVRWVPESQGGNHRDPYPEYHRLMRKWASECGVLKIFNL
jgi:hypothetical protein